MATFNEKDHPREEDGKFAPKGEGKTSAKDKFMASVEHRDIDTQKQANSPDKLAKQMDEKKDFSRVSVDDVKEYMSNLGYKVKSVEETDDDVIVHIEGNEEYKNKVWRELYDEFSDELNVMNYGDDRIGISKENHKQRIERINKEKEDFVIKALESGKYKGTIEEIAEQIYQDSPYSIHSHEQMVELVKKHSNK